MRQIIIIADNGGGLTLQIGCRRGGYQHSYDAPRQCARDIVTALADMAVGGLDLGCWEGNEAHDCWLTWTPEDESCGGYVVHTPHSLIMEPAKRIGGHALSTLKRLLEMDPIED